MAIACVCPHCGRSARVPDAYRGKPVVCPQCKNTIAPQGPVVPDYDVFISHSEKDRNIANAICTHLESRRIRCWIAPRDVPPGSRWASAIIEAIGQCNVMVLIFSGHANASEQVLREVERAVAKGVIIIPVRIQDVRMSADLEYFLSARHWLDALDGPIGQHLEVLSKQVAALLAKPTANSPSLPGNGSGLRRGGGEHDSADPAHAPRSHVQWKILGVALALGVIAAAVSFYRVPGRNGESARAIAVKSQPSGPEEESSPERPEATKGRRVSVVWDSDCGWTEDRHLGTLTLPGRQTVEFVPVWPSNFSMGSDDTEMVRRTDEARHSVTLTKIYWLSKCEITQSQWTAVTGSNPSFFQGGQSGTQPVEQVSWEDCQAFLATLEEHHLPDFRLPTEAEWEYACRASIDGPFFFGKSEEDLQRYGWFLDNQGGATHPVGQKKPNFFGFYDMYGNVREWCSDFYGPYPAMAVDPTGPESGTRRVVRGGDLLSNAAQCRSAFRASERANVTDKTLGFRLARSATAQP